MSDHFIHGSAIVDSGAEIGVGTRIWHFCHIMEASRIGKNCVLGQNVFVGKGVVIGNGAKIQNNVSLYTGVNLEDDVFIGPSVVFTNVINPRSFIERKAEFRQTIVGKGASIGANATVICGNRIGSYAMVGAGAVVTRSVPDFAVVIGNPARIKGWVGIDGSPLRFEHKTGVARDADGRLYELKNNAVSLLY